MAEMLPVRRCCGYVLSVKRGKHGFEAGVHARTGFEFKVGIANLRDSQSGFKQARARAEDSYRKGGRGVSRSKGQCCRNFSNRLCRLSVRGISYCPVNDNA